MNQGQYLKIIKQNILNNTIKMEYQKIRNMLDNASNEPSKFKTRDWVDINDESRGT